MKAWVTGAAGSIGSALLEALGPDAVGTDIEVDITEKDWRSALPLDWVKPDVIFHCAAEKSATTGEFDPERSAAVNITGTANLLATGIPIVLASTCKAADPETVYGATKLVAERMVLNAGGWVARFYNVIESSGNVFEIWRRTLEYHPIKVTPCWRYFIHLDQAVELMTSVLDYPPGRYTIHPGEPVYIPFLAQDLYEARSLQFMPPRRGDRIIEPLHAQAERMTPVTGDLWRIEGPHDPK